MRGVGRAASPVGQSAPHASHGDGRPAMGLRSIGEQRQQDVRFAHGPEAASEPPHLGAQDIRVVLGRTRDERQGLAQPTRRDPHLVNTFRLTGERSRGFTHHGVGQRADHLCQVARRRRGSMAHLRRPAPVTSL